MFANVRINRPLQQNIEARANHKVFLKSFGVPSAMEKKVFHRFECGRYKSLPQYPLKFGDRKLCTITLSKMTSFH
jgi:hypothetical protein